MKKKYEAPSYTIKLFYCSVYCSDIITASVQNDAVDEEKFSLGWIGL